MSDRNHDRSDDQTAISISLPKSLKDAIDAAAKADRRKRSNWIVSQLEAILNAAESEDSPPKKRK